MNTNINKRTLTNWEKSEKSLLNYQKYISRKADRFQLNLIDLLYISNFKGGNATINEDERIIEVKLEAYSRVLLSIDKEYSHKTLVQLSDLQRLIELGIEFINLSKKSETAIDGFKSSFLSTLLHSYFPNLFPILDRRLLINLDLISETNLSKDKQVKDIAQFYSNLIEKVQEICRFSNKTIREMDKDYFNKPLPNWAK